MVNDEQRELLLEVLSELEAQINPGEYYSMDPRHFVQDVNEVERLFGVKYEFSSDHWKVVDGKVVHENDAWYRRW